MHPPAPPYDTPQPIPPPPSTPRPTRRLLLGLALAAGTVLAAWEMQPRDAFAQTVCGPDTHQPSTVPPTVLIGTTPTRLPQLCGRSALELQNNGPNPIWCAVSYVPSHAAVGTSRIIAAKGGSWSLPAKDTQPIFCVAEGAAQVAFNKNDPANTGGTTVSEVK